MSSNEEPTDLDWIQLKRELSAQHQVTETNKEKFIRKFSQNPFVPIGSVLTLAALSYGLWSFRKGDRVMSQKMMRARILAQGFTISALIVGVILTGKSLKE